MKIHYGFVDLPAISDPVVSVGSFDGVHRGHRLLISRLNELAVRSGGESVVVTFSPHPRQLLRGENRLLTTLPEKLILLEETGLRNVIVVDFTYEFSKVGADEFMERYLKGLLGARTIVSGESHHFGHQRTGDSLLMTQSGLDNQSIERYDNISSTLVRDTIERGAMQEAADLLGGGYLIETPVDDRSKLLPPPGEYIASINGSEPQKHWIDLETLNSRHRNVRILSEIEEKFDGQ